MNFSIINAGKSSEPKLLLGAPADVADEYDYRNENTSKSSTEFASKQCKPTSDGICVSHEDDLSDAENELGFLCDDENAPPRRYQLNTTYSLDQKLSKKKKKRKSRSANLSMGISLPALEDLQLGSDTNNSSLQLETNEETKLEIDQRLIENLRTVWRPDSKENKSFFDNLKTSFSEAVDCLSFFALFLHTFKTEKLLGSNLFETCFDVLEKYLTSYEPAVRIALKISVQQMLFESIYDLDFTPNVKKCIELYRLKDVMGNAFVYVIQKLRKDKNFKVI